uniref:SCP domain-containing protein n=1 Tax=Heligmosomoides polygyrus TaxID=6339 RepID=A0A183GHV1_HELPZ
LIVLEEPHHLRCTDSVLTLQHKEYILYTHNRLRSKLAFGKQPNKEGMMGSGKNIYLLVTWNSLRLLMSSVCRTIKLPFPEMGLRYQSAGISSHDAVSHEQWLMSWWTEYKRHGNIDAKNRYFSRQLYFNWANMAKGRTTRFGCSYSYCAQGFRSAFSCIYNETQSENQTIYEQGRPCEFDTDCSTFPRSECVSSIGMCKAPLRVKGKRLHRTSVSNVINAYDCDLEKYAQLWADNCDFKHSSRWERPEQGQNLYMTSFRSLDKASLLNTAIEMWWNELEEYGIPADAMLSEEVWNTKGRHIGHFTQMAWSDSYRLGCAIAICSDMSFVVCHYSPAACKFMSISEVGNTDPSMLSWEFLLRIAHNSLLIATAKS